MSKRSHIWLYFLPIQEKGSAKCKVCSENKIERTFATPNAATSSLWDHLRSEHHSIWETLRNRPATPTAPKSTSKQISLFRSFNSSTSAFMDQRILRFIVDNHVSFNLTSKETFKELFSLLGYTPPSRKQIGIMIDEAAVQVRGKLRKQMLEWSTTIALTTDGWTDDAHHTFVSVTAHFLDSTFKLHSRCLDLIHLQESHTGEAVQQCIQNAVNYFVKEEEETKISILSLTTDNGANMKKAVRLTCWPGIECFAHTLQLCIKTSMDGEENGIFTALLSKVMLKIHFI